MAIADAFQMLAIRASSAHRDLDDGLRAIVANMDERLADSSKLSGDMSATLSKIIEDAYANRKKLDDARKAAKEAAEAADAASKEPPAGADASSLSAAATELMAIHQVLNSQAATALTELPTDIQACIAKSGAPKTDPAR